MQLFFLWVFAFFLCTGCSRDTGKSYKIAFDPLWYPWNFQEKTPQVLGFSTELLTLIAQEERLSLSLMQVNWDDLLDAVETNTCQGALSALFPYNFYDNHYRFSHVYLPLGPVLLVPYTSSWTSLQDLSGKEVGIINGSSALLIAKSSPSISIRSFDTESALINDFLQGKIDAALLPVLSATIYTEGTFAREFKIVTAPLNTDGLRLLTQKDGDLVKKFDRALLHLQKQGSYQKLLQKWDLSHD